MNWREFIKHPDTLIILWCFIVAGLVNSAMSRMGADASIMDTGSMMLAVGLWGLLLREVL